MSRGGGVGVDSDDYNKRTIKGVSFNPAEHTKQRRYSNKKYSIILYNINNIIALYAPLLYTPNTMMYLYVQLQYIIIIIYYKYLHIMCSQSEIKTDYEFIKWYEQWLFVYKIFS